MDHRRSKLQTVRLQRNFQVKGTVFGQDSEKPKIGTEGAIPAR